ncbi:hypothetical protein FRC03_001060 [Tulasnella sp. 419]|nr:hypothetical protein FRC03_001060 [Tulasnella sp. 419]
MTAFTVVHVRFPLLRNTLNNSHRHRIGLFRTAKDDESLPSVVEEKEPLEVVRSPPKQMSEEGKAPENWDDDFLFQTTTSDDPRAAGANHVDTFKEPRGLRDSIAWDDDEDEPPLKQNTLLAGKAPAVVDDDVNWGDSDDEDDRQLPFTPEKQPRQTSSSHNASSLEPSPQKWSDIDDQSDAVDDFSQTPSHLNDVDRTITLKTRYQPPNSALSSSSSLHSHSQIHFPPPRTGTSPIPYSPSSPTMSAFSIGQSSTAHLQLRPTTSDRSSSVGAAPIVPPPRSRRRLKKKTRPANAPGVSDIFEMEDVRGFREELEEYSMTPATHLPAHSTASLQQQQQQQQHQQQQLEGMGLHYLQQDQDSAPSSLSHLPMSDTEIDRVHQDTSMHSNPSSHSASRTPIFSQIGLMKKWSSKRRSRSNSQTNPPTAGLMEPPSRPMSPKTPEPQRPTSPRPWMFRAASTTPPSTLITHLPLRL